MARYFGGYFAPVTSFVDAYFGPSAGGIVPTALSSFAFSTLALAAVPQSTLAGTVPQSSLVLSPVPQSRLS